MRPTCCYVNYVERALVAGVLVIGSIVSVFYWLFCAVSTVRRLISSKLLDQRRLLLQFVLLLLISADAAWAAIWSMILLDLLLFFSVSKQILFTIDVSTIRSTEVRLMLLKHSRQWGVARNKVSQIYQSIVEAIESIKCQKGEGVVDLIVSYQGRCVDVGLVYLGLLVNIDAGFLEKNRCSWLKKAPQKLSIYLLKNHAEDLSARKTLGKKMLSFRV